MGKLITRYIVKMCNDNNIFNKFRPISHYHKDYSDSQQKQSPLPLYPQTVNSLVRRLNIKHLLGSKDKYGSCVGGR